MRRPAGPGLLPVLLAFALAACSDSAPSKGDLTRTIDAKLGQQVCFMGQPVSWPLKLAEGGLFGGGPRALPPFLEAMQRAGYVQVQHTTEQRGPLLVQNVAVVTPPAPLTAWLIAHPPESEKGLLGNPP